MLNGIKRIVIDLAMDALLHAKHLKYADSPPNVNDEQRPPLANYLTHVLVNKLTRERHNNHLQNMNVVKVTASPQTLRKALCRGLNALDGKELASLTLDAIGLNSLAHAIDHETPDVWHKAINEEGFKTVKSGKKVKGT